MELKNKFILDACCGGRMMWTIKQHPNAIYMDIRKEEKGFIKGAEEYEVKPDIIGDFTNLPPQLKEMRFKLIVWDIPHFIGKRLTGILTKKFGCWNPETWQYDINKGFKELWGVLEDYGVLILKFSSFSVSFDKLLKNIPEKPLFYNKVAGAMNTDKPRETKWFCFMKIPNANEGGVFTQAPAGVVELPLTSIPSEQKVN